ncbi:MAG: flagellin N-terminal helical domain-containing protein [Gammaproteobacteria bacterium]
MLTIASNIASLIAQNNLSKTQDSLQTSLQRLSSGLRINSAKDDAAGLYTAELMSSSIRGNNQAIRNANDGTSLAQTAEGALAQIANNIQRIREIAVQSANGTVQDRTGLQAETDQLTQEISRITQTSTYTGVSLFTATTSVNFQVGSDGTATNQVAVATTALNVAGSGGLYTYAASLTGTGTVLVNTAATASAAIANMDTDIAKIAQQRATFGAVQNRFAAVVANLTNYVQNLTAARSRITDTDFAAETANLTRMQVLQQAGTAMLSQANALPQSVLALLR